MANVLKVLGQAVPASANTDIDVYTVPSATSALVSTIVVSNLTDESITAQVRIRVAGAAAADKQLIAKNFTIGRGDLEAFTLGIGLATTDVVSFQASTVSCSCQVFGQEIT